MKLSYSDTNWPDVGQKLIAAKHPKHHWFKIVVENCSKLEIGQQYTVKKCEPASSWCCIELEEFDGWFCLSAFEWEY